MKNLLVIVSLMLLSSCAYNDHSRVFVQYVFVTDSGCASVHNETLVEKSGSEASHAENKPDVSPTIPLPTVF